MRTDIVFLSGGLKLAGHLYTPDPRPAIVVGHPGSGVKEQACGLYAERLAEQGLWRSRSTPPSRVFWRTRPTGSRRSAP